MQITINGKIEQIENNLNIAGLLEEKKVESPDMVSVQLNGAIIDRARYEATDITEDDSIEFLYFMGGQSVHFGVADCAVLFGIQYYFMCSQQ